MLNNFLFQFFNFLLTDIYNRNVKKFGYTPRGLFWNSKDSQFKRFKIIAKLIEENINHKTTRIADVGCGYGDLLTYFQKDLKVKFHYEGYDINKHFIKLCKKKHKNGNFFVSDSPNDVCDFSIMNGTYNFAVYESLKLWEKYIEYNLKKCFRKSEKGIIFSLQQAEFSKIENSIYYVNKDLMEKKLVNLFKNVKSFYSEDTPRDIYFVVLRG
tara:strand:- start:456 stop:1091 length:636 start_codon:yes stop_codon:yes gene_type:complete